MAGGVENLKRLSPDEARKLGAAGGIASGESRRRKKILREHLQALLETRRDGVTMAEAITLALAEKALSGDVRAFEVIRDTIGEKPVEKTATEVDASVSVSLTVSVAVAAALNALDALAEGAAR